MRLRDGRKCFGFRLRFTLLYFCLCFKLFLSFLHLLQALGNAFVSALVNFLRIFKLLSVFHSFQPDTDKLCSEIFAHKADSLLIKGSAFFVGCTHCSRDNRASHILTKNIKPAEEKTLIRRYIVCHIFLQCLIELILVKGTASGGAVQKKYIIALQ